MKKTNVIVTGAAGFVGSNLCVELERRGYRVLAIDNLSTGSILNLKHFKGEFICRDLGLINLSDYDEPEIIFHMAAVSDTRLTNEQEIVEHNYKVFKNLVKYSAQNGTRLVYASSAAVYGRPSKMPISEKTRLNPLNAYGVSKAWMENYAKEKKANAIGLRYFNIYGNGEQHKFGYASMVTQIMQAMKENRPIQLYKFGEQYRDQVYVKDVVNATILAGEKKHVGILNIGSGQPTSFNKIYAVLKEKMKSKSEVEYIDNPWPFYQPQTIADITLAKKELGYTPKYSFTEGVEDYIKEMKLNGI